MIYFELIFFVVHSTAVLLFARHSQVIFGVNACDEDIIGECVEQKPTNEQEKRSEILFVHIYYTHIERFSHFFSPETRVNRNQFDLFDVVDRFNDVIQDTTRWFSFSFFFFFSFSHRTRNNRNNNHNNGIVSKGATHVQQDKKIINTHIYNFHIGLGAVLSQPCMSTQCTTYDGQHGEESDS